MLSSDPVIRIPSLCGQAVETWVMDSIAVVIVGTDDVGEGMDIVGSEIVEETCNEMEPVVPLWDVAPAGVSIAVALDGCGLAWPELELVTSLRDNMSPRLCVVPELYGSGLVWLEPGLVTSVSDAAFPGVYVALELYENKAPWVELEPVVAA